MMKMRKPGYIALAVLMVATIALTGCSNVTEAKGSPTTEKEKVAEKTPQKRVKVIVENAAETAIETVRLAQKTEGTENLEPEPGAEEDTAGENTEGENETGTKQGKTEETDQSDKNKSGKKKNTTVADTTDSNKPPHDGMIYDVNEGTWIDMPEVHPDGFDRSAAEEVWSYVNAERTAAGLNALTWDEDIYNFACQRAQAIVSDFSHNGCGNYGENIALNSAGSAYRIHMQWKILHWKKVVETQQENSTDRHLTLHRRRQKLLIMEIYG